MLIFDQFFPPLWFFHKNTFKAWLPMIKRKESLNTTISYVKEWKCEVGNLEILRINSLETFVGSLENCWVKQHSFAHNSSSIIIRCLCYFQIKCLWLSIHPSVIMLQPLRVILEKKVPPFASIAIGTFFCRSCRSFGTHFRVKKWIILR